MRVHERMRRDLFDRAVAIALDDEIAFADIDAAVVYVSAHQVAHDNRPWYQIGLPVQRCVNDRACEAALATPG